MKKLFYFFIVGMLISEIGHSQDLTITDNSKLFYKFNEFDKAVTYEFAIKSITPTIAYEWSNSNKGENGLGIVTQEAMEGAINLTFYYIEDGFITLYDRTPSFLISRKIYEELKETKKSRIRIQDNENTNTLELIGIEDYDLIINKEEKKVKVLHATLSGDSGYEIWILDNPGFPIVVKLKTFKEYELKEVKQ
ncbi:MAG: hypothetical protein A3F72_06215 [Bacteroidetes bacterium RIFCSPLOWO2_12_FULL_35_15]|nr:MAG: hypothetical protein A3F72_06215 [Bacteroidetes bacterium RIFCSPLOWO2_12_FULL_35_15]